jgi:hypothetical protein
MRTDRISALMLLTTMMGLILLASSPVVAADTGMCPRSYLLELHLSPSDVTEKTVQIVYDASPALTGSHGELKGRILTAEGTIIHEISLWDPRIQFGEDVVVDQNGTVVSFMGVESREAEADLVAMLPYSVDANRFELSDSQGALMHTVDLTKAIDRTTGTCDATFPSAAGAAEPASAPTSAQSGLGIESILVMGAAFAAAALLSRRV